jgi:hypothetical protein
MTEPKWCYSTNEERYTGSFDTEAEACTEAEQELERDMLPGDTAIYYIGQVAPADTLLSASKLGDWAEERMDETLADEIGLDYHIVELTKDEKEELGRLMIDYVKSKNGFRAWGVKGIQERTYYIMPADDGETK